MTDHDAIAARVRQGRKAGTPGPWKRGKNNPARVSREGRYIADFDPLHSKAQICENDAARAAFLPDLEEAYLDLYDEVTQLRAERDSLQAQCCMCGKTGLSTIEDGGPECELDDGRWVCSVKCYDRAASNPLEAEAERDLLRAALSQIAHGRERIDISYREFLDEFVRPLACAALKGPDE